MGREERKENKTEKDGEGRMSRKRRRTKKREKGRRSKRKRERMLVGKRGRKKTP
jgi:hypothetical protein